MDELESQVLLEALEDAGRHARIQQLANGEYVLVAPGGLFLWDKRDVARYRKGSLQRSIERKRRKEEAAVT